MTEKGRYMQKSLWLTHTQERPARRLFCFPYAGGGASLYRHWLPQSSTQCEICPIQLPGRENRFGEPAFTDMPSLVQTLTAQLLPYLNVPFAFFGHSMGGLIAFALTQYLRQHALPQPSHLFISAQAAPQLPFTGRIMHTMDDRSFIAAIADFGGTPHAVLENQELMHLMLPLLRADFTLYETYIYTPEPPLDFPIHVFGGLQDHLVPESALSPWRAQTNDIFSLTLLPGDHFFLNLQRVHLFQSIARHLSTPSM
jgi:medium-chain acyl-[acyl-carrier-protein] hydrolase